MRRICMVSVVLFIAFSYIGCERDTGFNPNPKIGEGDGFSTFANPELIARELTEINGWQVDENSEQQPGVESLQKPRIYVMNLERKHIRNDIFHYKFEVRTGPDPFDIIAIHRVVKVRWFGMPIHTKMAFFFQHGDAKDFTGMMLPGVYSASTPIDFGMAVYLAEKNVDVWGIDQAWTLVPGGLTDLSFMKDWGLQRQIDDLNIAIAIARYTRLFSGSGFGKMILSGYSSGVFTGYAFLNQETQIPVGQRQVCGFIPVDFGIKISDPYFKEMFAGVYLSLQDALNNGVYQEDIIFSPLGMLARTDPDGPSPIFEGFTNLQSALFFGAGQIFGEGAVFHYLAGDLEEGMPVALKFVTNEQWFDFLESAPPYEPFKFELDYAATMSDAAEVPFDDYLSQINVPILNLAAAGGAGDITVYSTTLVGSDDIEHLIVSAGTATPEEDFGHIDIFIASNAPTLVWEPMYQWIKSHARRSEHEDVEDLAFYAE
ncbi:hypothetical protein JXB12_05850 [candidate division KSB1 bacterium]|nr:hypothetical protein [candidate division KSB1 bacterium]